MTEMWCALSDGPIYAGLRAGMTAADVDAAIRGSVTLSAGTGEFLALFTARGGVDLDGKPMGEGASALLEPGTTCVASSEDSRVLLTRFKSEKAG